MVLRNCVSLRLDEWGTYSSLRFSFGKADMHRWPPSLDMSQPGSGFVRLSRRDPEFFQTCQVPVCEFLPASNEDDAMMKIWDLCVDDMVRASSRFIGAQATDALILHD